VGDNSQTFPIITNLPVVPEATNESIESPLFVIASRRTESEVVEVSLRGNIEVEQTGRIIEDRTNDLPEAL
jgi:hypothetical protein